MPKNILDKNYTKRNIALWEGEKTMSHASGIWGRPKLFSYLKKILKPGNIVVDLGCGAGYPTFRLLEYVGKTGKVFGYDNSALFIKTAKKLYKKEKNIFFRKLDIARKFPHASGSVDCFVSFMLMQNLKSSQVDKMFQEVRRCLKPNGTAVFLTLHPKVFDLSWNLEFIKYDSSKIMKWRKEKQDDILIPGFVKNATGGKKSVYMYTKTHAKISELVARNNLQMVKSMPIRMDPKTAAKFFGKNKERIFPRTPTFWILVLKVVS